MKHFRARALLLPGLLLLVSGFLFLSVRFYAVYSWISQPLPIETEFLLELDPGSTFSVVSTKIAEHLGGITPENSMMWALHARFTGSEKSLKAGDYVIKPGMTPKEITLHLVSGQVVYYSFRIQEGWTVSQLRESLRDVDNLLPDTAAWPDSEIAKLLGLDVAVIEGRFFPDTYRYIRGDSDQSILFRAYEKMQQVIDYEWEHRAEEVPLKNTYDALTLASIIEKETGQEADRVHISQVFNNRLIKNMRLQTDPTVIYGLGKHFDGNLTRNHLDTDTVYNTYTRRGLPPTPISLPGLASIRAALHPSQGALLYFVGKGDGSSVFSDNLDDHLSAVRRFQLGKKSP